MAVAARVVVATVAAEMATAVEVMVVAMGAAETVTVGLEGAEHLPPERWAVQTAAPARGEEPPECNRCEHASQ